MLSNKIVEDWEELPRLRKSYRMLFAQIKIQERFADF